MSEPIIKVEGLSKMYTLNKSVESQSDLLLGKFFNQLKNLKDITNKKNKDEFWALKDVSFEINQGDRVGIIGRNGAGKSTLLKILSRITPPTKGRIEYSGRMASLLEVGTGFHGDLSGRENIYLNGSILGMNKQEIDKKFDEIVAFAEVEKFLDTPVKRYSSGMYVRLAFAVAAHLEPEILIVDEVLAVGDAAFQKKCLGKMNDVSAAGRTVLFVSHQMASVQSLCNKSILLSNGSLLDIDSTDKIINKYLQSGIIQNGLSVDNSSVSGDKKLKIRKVAVLNNNSEPSSEINNLHNASIIIEFEVIKEGRGYDVSFELIHLQHGSIFTSCVKDNDTNKNDLKYWEVGKYSYSISLPLNFLREGNYYIKVGSAIPKLEVLDEFQFETSFSILDSVSPVAKTTEGRSGAVLPILEWNRIK